MLKYFSALCKDMRLLMIKGMLLLLVMSGGLHAQNGSQWRFGQSAGVVFSGGTATGIVGSAMQSVEGCATQADAAGNLLFYTNGATVWNRNNQVMLNGSGMLGEETASQSALIIPRPGQPNRFYLITVSASANTAAWSEIDMTLDGGNGGVVTATKNSLFAFDVLPKVTGTRHCNGTDYWFVLQSALGPGFSAYLVTSTGINTTPVNSNSGFSAIGNQGGYMKISPNGRRLVSCLNNNMPNTIFLCNFDPSTGQVSSGVLLASSGGEYGVSFSPDNRLLYVSASRDSVGSLVRNEVYQFNLMVANVSLTKQVIYSQLDTNRKFGALQLGPDKRIYLVQRFKDQLNAILQPNQLGAACNFQDSVIFLPNSTGRLGLPNFMDYLFNDGVQARFSFTAGCVGAPVSFTDSSFVAISTRNWNFDLTGVGSPGTSAQTNPTHTFNVGGTYTVRLIVSDGCFSQDTLDRQIAISTTIPVDIGPDSTRLCIGTPFTLSTTQVGGYDWQFGQPGNFVSNGNTTSSQPVSSSGWYKLIVNSAGCTGSDSAFVNINTTPPIINLGGNQSLCFGQSLTLDAGNPGSRYTWSNGSTTQTVNVTASGTYRVRVEQDACEDIDSVVITVGQPVTVELGSDKTSCEGQLIELLPVVSSNVTGYTWSNGATNSSIAVTDTGKFVLTVRDVNNCEASDSLIIRSGCPQIVSIPNAFTPDDNGLNDIFRPTGLDTSTLSAVNKDYLMEVYSRIGEQVFASVLPGIGWDGTYNGSMMMEGRYAYFIRYTDPTTGNVIETRGTVHLLR